MEKTKQWLQAPRDIHEIIGKADPSLNPDDKSYQVAAILLASAIVGPDVSKIFKKLRVFPRHLIEKAGKNFRTQGIWGKKRVNASGWFDKDTGETGFFCDVLCGQGLLRRIYK